MSPTNISFSYSLPNLSEFKNFSAVGPIGICQANFGSAYFPFPKLTRSFGVAPLPNKSSLENP